MPIRQNAILLLHEPPSIDTEIRSGHASNRLTQQELEELLRGAGNTEQCAPYLPAFNGNPVQLGLPELGIGELAGKRVLDVGCNIGLRCFQAKAAGAAEVVGIDINPVRVAQARALAVRLDLPIELHCLDADRDLPPGRHFDLVLCCGVLERSRDPAALIGRLAEVARERLVLETEGVEGPHASQYLRGLRIRWWARGTMRRMPLMLVGRSGPNPRCAEARFYFSPLALQRLALFHQPHLGDVRVARSPTPGRYVATARRRRIGNLVIVAGASCAGKTTFVNGLHTDAARELLARVGLRDLAHWRVASESDYHKLPASLDRLCLHYDMNEAVRYGEKDFAHDRGLALIRSAETVTVLTFWAELPVLLQRKRRSEHQISASLPESSWHFMRLLRSLRMGAAERRHRRRLLERIRWDIAFLSHPGALAALYRRWFRFCETIAPGGQHVIDTTDDGYTLLEVASWSAPQCRS